MNTSDSPTPPANTQNNVVPLQQQPEPPRHRKVMRFVQDHPIATIAGGVALGAVAAALIPRRNRRFIAKRSSMWADAVTAASAAIAQQAIGQIEGTAAGMRSQAHSLAGRAGRAGHSTIDRMEQVGHSSMVKARSLLGSRPKPGLSEKLAAKAGKLMRRLQR